MTLFRIIPRAEWGARHENGSGSRPLPATKAWLHHSVTIAPDLLPPFDDDYAAIRRLEEIGEERFGRGISYTRCITPAGLVFEGHSIGQVGSHTYGYNVTGVGYCLVGNYEDDPPTEKQIMSLAWCVQYDHANGWLDHPSLDGGHRDLKQTACPGKYAYALIPTINQLASGPRIREDDVGHVDSISDDAASKIANHVLWRDSDPQEAENVPVWVAINGIRDRVDELHGMMARIEGKLDEHAGDQQ